MRARSDAGPFRALAARMGADRGDDTIVTIDTFFRRIASISTIVACVGCNGLLDIHDLPVAAQETSDGGADASPEVDVEAGDVRDGCGAPDDRLNCGACGHDCLGGECVDGACRPVGIYDALGDPASIAADPEPTGNVWVADATAEQIWRVAKDGSSSEQVRWAAAGFTPISLKVDAKRLFWIETQSGVTTGNDVVFQTSKTNLAARIVSPTTWPHLNALDIDASHVFFVNETGADAVVRAPLSLSPTTTIVHGPATPSIFLSVAVAPTGDQLLYGGLDGLFTSTLDGAAQRQLSPTAASAIAVDDSRAWFTHGTGISWMRLDGTCPSTADCSDFAEAAAVALTVDRDFVYWSVDKVGLRRMAKGDPSSVKTIASVHPIGGIAFDANAIYFTSPGKVWRLAK